MRANLAGPSSSTDKSKPKLTDPGKQAAAGTGGDYRRIATATGPAATKGSYTATLDPGKELPSSIAGSPADFYSTQRGGNEGEGGSVEQEQEPQQQQDE